MPSLYFIIVHVPTRYTRFTFCICPNRNHDLVLDGHTPPFHFFFERLSHYLAPHSCLWVPGITSWKTSFLNLGSRIPFTSRLDHASLSCQRLTPFRPRTHWQHVSLNESKTNRLPHWETPRTFLTTTRIQTTPFHPTTTQIPTTPLHPKTNALAKSQIRQTTVS